MNPKNLKPIFIPDAYCAEIESLSKAELMDIVWNFSVRCSDKIMSSATMATFRTERDGTLGYRKAAAKGE